LAVISIFDTAATSREHPFAGRRSCQWPVADVFEDALICSTASDRLVFLYSGLPGWQTTKDSNRQELLLIWLATAI
jgi:hypothetical protein